MKYLHLTAEAVIPLDDEVPCSIRAFLDDLRGQSSARIVNTKILETDQEYEDWYRTMGVSEIEIPIPTKIKID